MKLKSLILGSVAAAGLSTAGYAADLGVLTSLDVCDALGLSGLTISSDTNCLQISGGVSYEFNFGDYRGEVAVAQTRGRFAWPGAATPGTVNYAAAPNSSAALPAQNGIWAVRDDATGLYVQPNGTPPGTTFVGRPEAPTVANGGLNAGQTAVQLAAPVAAYAGGRNDWESKVEAWVKFVGSADSDFGVAKATIVLKQVDQQRVLNANVPVAGGDNTPLQIDEAYVSVGDSTVIMAGKKGSIANFGDARPFNWVGLFGNNRNDGTLLDKDADANFLKGHVIQITSDLGNGVTAAAGLERLDTTGTAVGVISYAGEGITAHATGYARGILDGVVDSWGMHVGATATFDAFKVRGAFAADVTAANVTNWAALVGAEATFDIFKIAADVEALGGSVGLTDYGVGGSVGAKVTEGVELNLGGKYYVGNNAGVTSYHVAAQIVAAVSESVKLTGEVGVWGNNTPSSDFYGKVGLDWAPGDATPKAAGFKAGVAGEVYQSGAYKLTFKASKTFE